MGASCRSRFAGCSVSLLALLLWLLQGLGLGVARAQSASVSDIQAVSTNVSLVNGGGFAIVNDGSLQYGGPLNAITPLEALPAVRLEINGQVLLDGVPPEAQQLVEQGRARSNRLSPELVGARIDVSAGDTVMLGIAGREPLPTALGGQVERQRTASVDGQSFSVFPDLQPSVFRRDLLIP